VAELVQVGTGRNADVFALGDGRVLRRYRDGGDVAAEAAGAQLAELHRRLHALPPRLGREPDDAILHLDLHPANVMLGSHGPVVIDWRNVAEGPADLDVAVSAVILAQAAVDDRMPDLAGPARSGLGSPDSHESLDVLRLPQDAMPGSCGAAWQIDPALALPAAHPDPDDPAVERGVEVAVAMLDDGPEDLAGDDDHERHVGQPQAPLDARRIEQPEGNIEFFAEEAPAVVMNLTGVDDHPQPKLAGGVVHKLSVVVSQQST
jgi:hypothetical protein